MQCREPQGQLFPLEPALEDELPDGTIEAVIARRGSSRRFRCSLITYQQLSTMLDRAAQAIPADFLDGPGATLNQLYLIVHDVEGLPSGSYVFHPQQAALEQLKVGDFREQAGYLGCNRLCPPMPAWTFSS
jgi:hypothetical protein